MSRDVLDEKIIDAIETLWRNVLEVRNFAGQFTYFQSILLPDEYGDAISGKAKGIIPHISRQEFNKQVANLLSQVETVRPFVGESIWALYSTYQAFAMRQILKIQDGLEKNKLYEWDRDFRGRPDNLIQDLLGAVFSEEDLSRINPDKRFGATARIMAALELKILNEINEWVFNRKYRPIDPERQQSIQNLITVLGDMNVGGDVVGRDKIA